MADHRYRMELIVIPSVSIGHWKIETSPPEMHLSKASRDKKTDGGRIEKGEPLARTGSLRNRQNIASFHQGETPPWRHC